MTDKSNCPSLFSKLFHFIQTLLLEPVVADRQHLVNNENFWIQMGGNRERKPNVHSGRIMLYRRVEEFFNLGKGNDLVELLSDFLLRHTEDSAVEEDVLPPTELRMEPGADLQQTRDAAVDLDAALCRLGDTGK